MPKEGPLSILSFEEILQRRRSCRDFTGEALLLSELAKLLSLSYGVTDSWAYDSNHLPLFGRAAPSAGALYPIEVYPIIFHVNTLERGIYHYNVKKHQLESLQAGDYRGQLHGCLLNQEFLVTSSVALLMTGIFPRTRIKYGERGYRYILFEAGHVAQNIYLVAVSMNLGCVTIGGFVDDGINELLGIDGADESVLYIALVGRRSDGST